MDSFLSNSARIRYTSAMESFLSNLPLAAIIRVALWLIGGATLMLAIISWRYYAFRRRLPPGPPGLPIVGNLLEMPKSHPWLTHTELRKKYGPIFSMQFGTSTVIFLGTYGAARDLLEKRSNIYSSRPRSVMVGECISQGNRSLILPYGEQWRGYRRLQGAFLSPRMSNTYRELQDLESKQLISEFLTRDDFFKRYHRYSSSLTFALAYGKRMPTGQEEEVKGVELIMDHLNNAFITNWIVDSLPFLNRLPRFMKPWQKIADFLGDEERDFFNMIRSGATDRRGYNWCKDILTMKEHKALTDTQLSYVIGNTYEAGADTTTMTLQVFTLACVLHQEKVKILQDEIDRVVGRDRLPTFEDTEKMPYLLAFVKEVHRWRPVLPGGVPHAVTEDDEYMGYHIPKGATIVGGHWAISMDEELYPNPDEFEPERFLKNPDLPYSQFGFGRRKCIGQYIGNNSMMINVSRMLWAYDIKKGWEIVDGKKIEADVGRLDFVSGFNSPPLPFKAAFIPRDGKVKNILQREFNQAEKSTEVILERIEKAQQILKEGEPSTNII
ncbi:cytochrome P450 [Periconia macrospinosa]|uniref:Cytochrome P450 n=1 Tax=Periconia macrospinosa TaxID=97972 RepID=A0A2V1D3L3_9PLEO|nr:cytochrome P450 [Periconia macrospinosa]